MRRRPATVAASFRGNSGSALPTAWKRQDDCTGPKALTHRSEECHIYQYWPQIRDSEEPLLRNPALASGPSRSKSKKLRRPQCPGNHSRARARFRFSPGDSPSRIASCHRRRRIVIQQARKLLTYALNSLCGTMPRTATENYFALVQKLWRMTLPCGSLRKSAKQSSPA